MLLWVEGRCLLFLHSIYFAIFLLLQQVHKGHTSGKPLSAIASCKFTLNVYFCSFNKILRKAAGIEALPLLYLFFFLLPTCQHKHHMFENPSAQRSQSNL